MATNFGWNTLYWGAGAWDGIGNDLTIQVGGTTNNTWGAGTFGTGY